MLSFASAVPGSFVDSCTGHDVSFSDHEFASWDLHDLIFEPKFEYETKPISSIPTSIQSNQNVYDLTETNQGPPGSIVSDQRSGHSINMNEPVGLVDRKLKRMRSNRESARRSRIRKQQHVDNLRNRATVLSSTNRVLSNRLRFILNNGLIVRSENQRLQDEYIMLRHRLIELQNLMIFQGINESMYKTA